MDRLDQIRQGLGKLEHGNDEHWTSGGKPRMDMVRALSGLDDVNRGEVDEAWPGLMRDADASALTEPVQPDDPRPDAVPDDDPRKQELLDALAEVEQELADAKTARDQAARDIDALGHKQRVLGMAYQALFPAMKHQEAVKAYQERSRAEQDRRGRHMKHERHKRSRLDEAMRDRRSFGMNRPEPFLLEKT